MAPPGQAAATGPMRRLQVRARSGAGAIAIGADPMPRRCREQRAARGKRPAVIDGDIGNRKPRAPSSEAPPHLAAPRAPVPASVDMTAASPATRTETRMNSGNEALACTVGPVIIDDDIGNLRPSEWHGSSPSARGGRRAQGRLTTRAARSRLRLPEWLAARARGGGATSTRSRAQNWQSRGEFGIRDRMRGPGRHGYQAASQARPARRLEARDLPLREVDRLAIARLEVQPDTARSPQYRPQSASRRRCRARQIALPPRRPSASMMFPAWRSDALEEGEVQVRCRAMVAIRVLVAGRRMPSRRR
jgi:hypothetical protein